jgi:hypothetical protein
MDRLIPSGLGVGRPSVASGYQAKVAEQKASSCTAKAAHTMLTATGHALKSELPATCKMAVRRNRWLTCITS